MALDEALVRRRFVIKTLILLAALALGASGCATQIEALAKDGATVCLRVKTTLYGEASGCRTNTKGTATMIIAPDGTISITHSGK